VVRILAAMTRRRNRSLAFAKVTVEYKTQGADGKLVAGTPVVWDVTKVDAG
jgi:hypothetical protein